MADLQFFKHEKFGACYKMAENLSMNEKTTIKVLHINTLIEEKEKSDRPKDREDAEQLKKIILRNTNKKIRE